jgi:hypothetical protein
LGGVAYGCDQRHWVPEEYRSLFDAVTDTLTGQGVDHDGPSSKRNGPTMAYSNRRTSFCYRGCAVDNGDG